MKSNQKLQWIHVDDLRLDVENPRLPDSLSRKSRDESKIINWMLQDASLLELMTAISENGFFVGESLLVVKENGQNVVIEGNRRLASVKLLNDPEIAIVHSRKVKEVVSNSKNDPDESLPCIIFESRESIEQYLGYRHVTGVKSWGVLAKARYLKTLARHSEGEDISELSKDLARKIGSRSDYVRHLLVAYDVYEVVVENGYFRVPGLNETTIHFNYFVDSIRRENVREFLCVDLNSDFPVKNLNIDNLNELVHWFFEKNRDLKTKVKGDSSSLSDLDDVLGSEVALEEFRKTGSINEAIKYISQSPETFTEELEIALDCLKRANSYIHRIDSHGKYDMDLLREIRDLLSTMRGAMLNKEEDW
ncbi:MULTISPECIES: hypothetical protein [Thalassolituus]|uniref:hypothetical protein n=1 Tax=Thalassolituus TaxID=187492 RepID=UPI000C48D143|nr:MULTISPECIES: hypothetical protein [Thalassolituus]MAX86740.1 hypothetical protein [Oceanospirillaceae bacterium]|tara:strand:- start:27 stop:1115 length:1089 start_codon:yes stop_codon:yes gene_type:complete